MVYLDPGTILGSVLCGLNCALHWSNLVGTVVTIFAAQIPPALIMTATRYSFSNLAFAD